MEAGTTVDDRPAYVPGMTLGRSGWRPEATDRLLETAEHLDALMCLVTHIEDDGEVPFGRLNDEIQYRVLSLASTLAAEVTELAHEIVSAEANKATDAAS